MNARSSSSWFGFLTAFLTLALAACVQEAGGSAVDESTRTSDALTFEPEDATLVGFDIANGAIHQTQSTTVATGSRLEIDFDLPLPTRVMLTGVVSAPDSGSNSFYVNIDDEPIEGYSIWDIPLTNGFESRDVSWRGNGTHTDNEFVPMHFDLSAGAHTLIVVGRESNTQLEQISIVDLTPPAPTPPPSNSMILEAENGVVSGLDIDGGAVYQASRSDLANGGRVELSFTLDVAANVRLRALVDAGTSGSNSFFVNIDAEPEGDYSIWDIPVTLGFEEREVSWRGNGNHNDNEFAPKTWELPEGDHTIVVIGREKNTYLDSIALDIEPSVTPPPPATPDLPLAFEAEDEASTGFQIDGPAIYQSERGDASSGARLEIPFDLAADTAVSLLAVVSAATTGSNSLYVSVDDEPVENYSIWDVPITQGFEELGVSWRGSGSPDANEFTPVVFELQAGAHTLIRGGAGNPTRFLDRITIVEAAQVPPPTTEPPPTEPPTSSDLLAVNFENQSLGEYTQAEMSADFNWRGNWSSGLGQGRTNIVSESGNQFLRCLFREGTRGHIQWQADLGGVYEDVILEYRVRFVGSDFDFRDGGKLPGLAGGTAPTGGQDSADGLGYSARFMWRNTSSNPDPYFTQYMYDMDKADGRTGRHVTLGGSPIYLETDHWYTVRSRILMNTPGSSDGVIQAWIDGELVLDIRDARLRSDASLGTDMLYFSTFFGGSNTAQYQTTKDEEIDYDDFRVYLP